MAALRKVLCPVDFSPSTGRQVRLAADLCRAFGAALTLHHNLPELAVGAGVGWMWAADHHSPFSEETAHRHLRDLAERLAPTLAVDTHVTHGAPSGAIIAVSRALDADLVIVSTHGASSDDHTSVTEQVLRSGHRAVLVLHDAGADAETPHFSALEAAAQVAVVPVDLTPDSRAALAWACDLGTRLGFELQLVHVLPRRSDPDEEHAAIAETQRQLESIVGADRRCRIFFHVERGDAARQIVRYAREVNASCIVMGEHTRAPLRRWFSHDTSRAVLHEAPCPVWYVPGAPGAPDQETIGTPPPA